MMTPGFIGSERRRTPWAEISLSFCVWGVGETGRGTPFTKIAEQNPPKVKPLDLDS